MIKPLSLSDIHDLCQTLDIAVDQGDYSRAMVESMFLAKLCALVNLAIGRAVATSTLPTCWEYKVQQFSDDVGLNSIMDFMNNLTGADIVQVMYSNYKAPSYVIYRIPII